MKIAILSPFYPFRGFAHFNARLYAGLSEHNTVAAFSFTTLYPAFLFPGKTQFLTAEDKATFVENRRVLSSVNPFSCIRAAKAINRFAPDALIIPYWMSFLAPAYGTVCRLLNKKIKTVALVHNAVSHERTLLDRPLAKYFFNRCSAFIVMSEPVKADLLSLRSDADVLLLSHPVFDRYSERIDKAAACRQLHLDTSLKTLLFFGFIREYKGLDLLLEATNYLPDGYQLVIAGECYGSFEKYARLLAQSPMKERITVLEQYIEDDMVAPLFSAADALILPYRSATQSGVVALAYQFETPLVVTDAGALGETVRSAQTGVVAKNFSPAAIAEAITEFFDSGKAPLYIANIREEKRRLSWSNFIGQTERFLNGRS
ncbi:MAG: glycosyltransferase [Prevotella sp.]|jgi:glycosyltransferase involved in cell wall biosynthesis|nr:glycosyltransferase [Prevotella sp.]